MVWLARVLLLMHSLVNYASSDDEDDGDDKTLANVAVRPVASSTTPPAEVPSTAAPPPPASPHSNVASSAPLSLPAPVKAATTARNRAAVLSSLASSLSSLHSSNSPFATSILDSSLDIDTPPPSTQSAPSPAASTTAAAGLSGGSSVVAVTAVKKPSLPSAASLLSALPSDSAGWERRTGNTASTARLDPSQYHAVPLPASLRPPASESDAFRFTPHTHSVPGAAITQRRLSPAPNSTFIPAATTQPSETTNAPTRADDAAPVASASKQLPSRPTGQHSALQRESRA